MNILGNEQLKLFESVENGETILVAHMTLRNDSNYDKESLISARHSTLQRRNS